MKIGLIVGCFVVVGLFFGVKLIFFILVDLFYYLMVGMLFLLVIFILIRLFFLKEKV